MIAPVNQVSLELSGAHVFMYCRWPLSCYPGGVGTDHTAHDAERICCLALRRTSLPWLQYGNTKFPFLLTTFLLSLFFSFLSSYYHFVSVFFSHLYIWIIYFEVRKYPIYSVLEAFWLKVKGLNCPSLEGTRRMEGRWRVLDWTATTFCHICFKEPRGSLSLHH